MIDAHVQAFLVEWIEFTARIINEENQTKKKKYSQYLSEVKP